MKVTQSRLSLCDPMDYIVHGILQARILEGVAFPLSWGSSQFRESAVAGEWLKLWHELDFRGESECKSLLQPHGLYSPWTSPGQNTGGDSLSLLQGIFPTQGSNTGLLHCRQILYHLNHQGKPSNCFSSVQSLSRVQLATP